MVLEKRNHFLQYFDMLFLPFKFMNTYLWNVGILSISPLF